MTVFYVLEENSSGSHRKPLPTLHVEKQSDQIDGNKNTEKRSIW